MDFEDNFDLPGPSKINADDDNELDGAEEDKSSKPSVVKPKTPIIRRPRNILRPEHLISKRGISQLPEIFQQTNFKGKGYELEDLKLLLFKTKHWAHRLFPNLTFEDFLQRSEHLGNKRLVKNFLNKIRMNQPLNLQDNQDIIQSDGESDNEDNHNTDNPTRNTNDDVPVMEQAALKFDMIFNSNNNTNASNNNNDSDAPVAATSTSDDTNHKNDHQDDQDDFIDDDDDYDDILADDNQQQEPSKES